MTNNQIIQKESPLLHILGGLEIEGIEDSTKAAWVADEIDYYLAKYNGMTNKRFNKGFKRYMRNNCIYKTQLENEEFFERINKLYGIEVQDVR